MRASATTQSSPGSEHGLPTGVPRCPSVARQNSCAAGAGRTIVTGMLVSQGSAPSGAGHGATLGLVCGQT